MFTTEMCLCVCSFSVERARVWLWRVLVAALPVRNHHNHTSSKSPFSPPMSDTPDPPGVLMLGTGEYTTGFVAGLGASNSDKSTGVVALVMLDLRRRGKIGRLSMCGTDGSKLPDVRKHMQRVLGVYAGIDPTTIKTYPEDGTVDRLAYKSAIAASKPGDLAIIFTPDDTHMAIAEACLAHGMHVMITKPPVKTLKEHNILAAQARERDLLCVVEVHKRFDPIYADARDRIATLGDFSYFTAHMSQPKHQLETFKAWAGRSSDISYYLNSHHVDFCEWALRGLARAERVTALASDGVATPRLGIPCEDTITLAVTWRNRRKDETIGASDHTMASAAKKRKADVAKAAAAPGFTGSSGHATFTSSWVAPKADVHSQQRWFYMGHGGEISVDQAHRGYTVSTDASGFASINPLFWKPSRDALTNEFTGQSCYGYKSFESFVDAATACNRKEAKPADFDGNLPTLETTAGATAILEAGRRSLDSGGRPFELVYADDCAEAPADIRPVAFA